MSLSRKSLAAVFIGIVIVTATFFRWFQQSGWYFSYEQQPYLRCLPIEFSLVNERPVNIGDLSNGSLVVVSTDNYTDYYPKDVQLLKLITGMPGDHVRLTEDAVFINGELISTITRNAFSLHAPYSANNNFILAEDQFWISGVNSSSVDSRYIGPVDLSHIKGVAYALL